MLRPDQPCRHGWHANTRTWGMRRYGHSFEVQSIVDSLIDSRYSCLADHQSVCQRCDQQRKCKQVNATFYFYSSSIICSCCFCIMFSCGWPQCSSTTPQASFTNGKNNDDSPRSLGGGRFSWCAECFSNARGRDPEGNRHISRFDRL